MVEPLPPIDVHADRGKAIKHLLICLAFVGGAAFMLRDEKARLAGLICFAVFSVFALIQIATLIRPPKLEIEADGFRISGLRRWWVPWSDVAGFRIVKQRRSSFIVIDYRERQPGEPRPGRRPGAIPAMLEADPEAVLAALQERFDQARPAAAEGAPQTAPSTVPEPRFAMPWLSIGLLAVLALLFAGEIYRPITPATATLQPSILTLEGFGGLSRLLVEQGQWYRLATAPFLHGSLVHLLLNGVALLLAGRLLEGVIGRLWFAIIYGFGALTGGFGSLLLNGPNVVSVGASGAILALFAAIYVCSFHYARSSGRYRLQSGAMGVLVPTLLSFGRSHGGMIIDFGAHLGGALGGALMGLLLLRIWQRDQPAPGRWRLAMAGVALGVLATVAAVWPALRGYQSFGLAADLMPQDKIPADENDFIFRAWTFVREYPKDPRTHLALAIHLLREGKSQDAEQEARAGLAANPVLLHDMLQSRTESSLETMLGEALLIQKQDGPALSAFDAGIARDPRNPEPYYWRGVFRLAKGDFAKAMPDADQAAALAPASPLGPRLKGDLLFALGDLDAAITAFGAAVPLDKTDASLRTRGLAELYDDKRDWAMNDFEKAAALDPKDLYPAIWLDIARDEASLPPLLSNKDQRVQAGNWPAPVARVMLGFLRPESLPAFAETPEKICESDFYEGVYNLVHAEKDEAIANFKAAGKDCQPNVEEGWASRIELERLQRMQ